jgi:hypothetical protein
MLVPLVAIVLLTYAFVTGGAIPAWGSVQRTAGIVGFLMLAWDYYLWRVPWLYPKIVPAPNLRGTWKGEATIFHLPQPTGTGKTTVDYEEIKGHVIIRQTGSGIKVTALWADDKYTSIMKQFAPLTGSDGRGGFTGQYENKAGITIGVGGITIYSTAHPNEANLYYVTIEDVPQRGRIVLTQRVRQFCDTRDEALALPLDSKRKLKQRLRFFLWPW